MGEKHKVYFEPVGIEIEVDEDETILDAAFRHGVMLMHGCKEGQCSACKSFLLDGDLEMGRFSTFALNEYEEEEGFVLLCRSHAYSDLDRTSFCTTWSLANCSPMTSMAPYIRKSGWKTPPGRLCGRTWSA